MTQDFFRLWVYLSGQPLFGLTLTLAAYSLGLFLAQRARLNPLANPVAIAVTLVVAVLLATGIEYPRYFEGAQFVHFLLGPATVALAVPIHGRRAILRRHLGPLLVSLLAGGAASALTALACGWALGASPETLLSMLPKSVTAPIAMGISEQIGGNPALTAVYCITTGILGAVVGRFLFEAMGIGNWVVRGFALGTAAHGIGTARAFQVNVEAGSFAALAFGLHGIIAAILIPAIVAVVR